MESSAYKEMMAQIANIAGYIREARDEKKRKRETEDKLLDTAQAAKMLNVSKRTMQRMRTDHRIEYYRQQGKMGKLFGNRQYQSFLLFDVVASPFDGLCTVTRIVSYQGNESRSSFLGIAG